MFINISLIPTTGSNSNRIASENIFPSDHSEILKNKVFDKIKELGGSIQLNHMYKLLIEKFPHNTMLVNDIGPFFLTATLTNSDTSHNASNNQITDNNTISVPDHKKTVLFSVYSIEESGFIILIKEINSHSNNQTSHNTCNQKEDYNLSTIQNHLSHRGPMVKPSRVDMLTKSRMKLFELSPKLHSKSRSNSKYNDNFFLHNSESNVFPIVTSPAGNKTRGRLSNESNISLNNVLGNSSVIEKLGALLHDFKHLIQDNFNFCSFVLSRYMQSGMSQDQGDTQNQNTIDEDINYMNTMKEYLISLVLNITTFLQNPNDFLQCHSYNNVDMLSLLEMMVKIFKRRLYWENICKQDIDPELMARNNTFKKKDIKIRQIVHDPENPVYRKILSNKNLLISLFYNILSNSYKYTETGEIIVEMSIPYSGFILVKITDSGKGIPSDILSNWGKPFNNKDRSKSTGLGQFIIESIAKNLKLTIPVPESNINKGTIVKIYIPENPINHQRNSSNLFSHSYTNFNQSSIFRCTTKPNMSQNPLLIDENIRNNINYNDVGDSSLIVNNFNFGRLSTKIANNGIYQGHHANSILLNPQFQKTYYILCLDDDEMYLSVLLKNLAKLNSRMVNCRFEIIYSNSFQIFMDELGKLITNNIIVDFFILDQNIGNDVTGLKIANMVQKIYKTMLGPNFDKANFNFLFITNDSDILKQMLTSKKLAKKYFVQDHIFGKMQFKELSNKIINLVRSNPILD
jgi:anti-sigma regulatory factor (Ser/Thr protein kinase)